MSASFFAPAVDPGAEILSELGGRLDPSWFILAMLVPLAVVVLWFGNRSFRQWRGAGMLEPRGRPSFSGRLKRDPEWDKTRARLEGREPTRIANASAGAVRIEGTITAAAGSLGGPEGRECVWRNRAGARADTAVAAPAIVVADATGRCGVENLEGARVIAPTEALSVHHESTGLYKGDRVEVLGIFRADPMGQSNDPTQLVYGTIGETGAVQIRLLDRPTPPAPSEPKTP